MLLYLNIADVKCDPLIKVDVYQVFPPESLFCNQEVIMRRYFETNVYFFPLS